MSGYRFSFPACMIAGKGRIDSYDVMMLRRYAFPQGVRRASDAQAMLELHRLCPTQSDDWHSYFVESLAAYVVNSGTMAGVIDERKAAWLIRAITEDGAVRTWLEVELLVHAIEIAASTSETLSAFALDQIRVALQPGTRTAYGSRRPAHPGITVFDLSYVWRILRPAVDRGRVLLSPLESMVMHEIDDLADESLHHPAWNELVAHIATLTLPEEPSRSTHWLRIDDDHMREEYAA